MSGNQILFQFNGGGDVFVFLTQLNAAFEKLNIAVGGMQQNATTAFNKLDASVTHFTDNTTKQFNELNNSVKSIQWAAIGQGFEKLGEVADNSFAPFMQFEQQMADLHAITGIAGNDLKRLGEASRTMGKESGLGASQAAEAFKLLASNIDTSKIGVAGLEQLQQATIRLAQSSGVDLPTAANTMAAAINQFHLPAEDAARVIDVLAAGAKYGAAEVPDLAESLKYVGTSAGIAGMSIEETTAALEILSQSNLKGSMAGTAMNDALTKIQTTLGISLKDGGLLKAIEVSKPHLNDAAWMLKHFGEQGARAMKILASASAEDLNTMNMRMHESGVAAEQAGIRNDTWTHKMQLMKAAVDDWKISISEATGPLLPMLGGLGNMLGTVGQMMPLMNALSAISKIQFVDAMKSAATATWGFIASMGKSILAIAASGASMVFTAVVEVGAFIASMLSATAATFGFNAVLLANPLVIFALGIAAIGVAVAAVIIYWDEITAAIGKAVDAVKGFFGLGGGEAKVTVEDQTEADDAKQRAALEVLAEEQKKKELSLGYIPATLQTGSPYDDALDPNKLFAGNNSKQPKSANAITDGLNSVTGGTAKGEQVRNINVTIQRIVGIENLHVTHLTEGVRRAGDVVLKGLVDSVRDSEQAISGN